jgi:hypothetical protein
MLQRPSPCMHAVAITLVTSSMLLLRCRGLLWGRGQHLGTSVGCAWACYAGRTGRATAMPAEHLDIFCGIIQDAPTYNPCAARSDFV